ncbi:MAG: phosphopentomutase [Deltaproteobacteria bacterium]|nr:phosphopentomutase [Deltaproteobacteria bacterium]
MTIQRIFLIILDSCGCGFLPDAADYGDVGADTLGGVARAVGGLQLPSLQRLGLGNIAPIAGVPPAAAPAAAHGKMREASKGKDTSTGHWEIAGLRLGRAFPVFPHGFPEEILGPFRQAAGRGVLGNKAASGTEIIEELGPRHLETGDLIVYTSADSVFQVAAHEEKVPLAELYAACQAARDILDPYGVGRVIARPFVGAPGSFKRTYNRKDYSMLPPAPTVLVALQQRGVPTIGIGKIGDIFCRQGLDEDRHTAGNADGLEQTLAACDRVARALVFVNLVDFDMLYGHRNDPRGYARALEEVDAWLPALQARLRAGDLVILTADHGNDPTFPGTDHTREHVPLLCYGPGLKAVDLGVRDTFADVGATVSAAFGAAAPAHGTSFLQAIT